MNTLFSFELTQDNTTQEVIFKDTLFSYISFKKIVFTSLTHLGRKEWHPELVKLNLQLQIICYRKAENFSSVVDLGQFVSVFQTQPGLDFSGEFTVPDKHYFSGGKIDKAIIKLLFTPNVAEKIRLSLLYEKYGRAEFSEIFQENADGSIVTKQRVNINGVEMDSGTRLPKGTSFGGVNLNDYKKYDMQIVAQNRGVIVKGFYKR